MTRNDNGATGLGSKTYGNCPFHVDHEKRLTVGEREREILSNKISSGVPWPVFRLVVISFLVPLIAFGGTYLVILDKLGAVQTELAVIQSRLDRLDIDRESEREVGR